jgi:hypothetical protein
MPYNPAANGNHEFPLFGVYQTIYPTWFNPPQWMFTDRSVRFNPPPGERVHWGVHSGHPTTLHAAYVDGSVRDLGSKIGPAAFWLAAVPDDGKTPNDD